MSAAPNAIVIDSAGAQALLADLCSPFANGPFFPDCLTVQPVSIPFPEDHLLVHHDHMTVVLQLHHKQPLEVHVLEEHLHGDIYTRRISLTLAGTDKIVEYGIVRLNFKYMPDGARRDILEKKTPLGAVLIKHDVHRRVKPRFFLKMPENSSIVALFGAHNPEPLYGRLGMIYCDGEPCIEVLEIVLNT